MNHIDKKKLFTFLEERLSVADSQEIKLELLHIAMMVKSGMFDIRIWED